MRYAIQIQHNDSFEYALKCAKNAGFKYVAIGFGSSKCFHKDDWEQEIIEIEKLLKENSLECIQTHLPTHNLLSSAEIEDKDTDKAILRCLEAGVKLGSEWNVYHARSAINDNYSTKKSMEYAKIAVAEFAEKANACKSGFAIENLAVFPDVPKWRFFTADYEDLCELHDYFKSEYVSVCWDFGHANLMGNNDEKVLEYVGDRIKCTHFHNNDRNFDQHYLPSQGKIEWEKLMPALKKTGYNGALTLELDYKNIHCLESFFRHSFDCLKYLDEIV